jgi:hypothetical protein
MKPILSLLLMLLLCGCRYQTSSHTAGVIAGKVKNCCRSVSMSKEVKKLVPAGSPEKTEAVSVLERNGQILTW